MTQQCDDKIPHDVQRAFDLQTEHKWIQKKTTAEQRIDLLMCLRDAVRRYEEEIKLALYLDLRKPADQAKNEIETIYMELHSTISHLSQWMKPVEYEASPILKGSRAYTTFEARGIILLFGPWNFPFSLVFIPLVQIISAGNCALVKPNELAPATSAVSFKILREIFDEQVVAVFEGGVDLANSMLRLPVDHVFFTGSPAVGKKVMAAAAHYLASVTLELGGKNPVIIDQGYNIKSAAQKIAALRNVNHGQVCLCPENVWVPNGSKEAFLDEVQQHFNAAYYKEGKLNTEACGRIIDARNLERVAGYIIDAVDKGAKVVCGGEVDHQAQVVEPTVLTDIPATANILQEEVFGPLLCVHGYDSLDWVIESIQKQHKPLALYLFSQDDAVVNKVLQGTSSGGVTVNGCMLHYLEHNLPFGGVNHSGIGRYRGIHGFKELSHERAVLAAK